MWHLITKLFSKSPKKNQEPINLNTSIGQSVSNINQQTQNFASYASQSTEQKIISGNVNHIQEQISNTEILDTQQSVLSNQNKELVFENANHRNNTVFAQEEQSTQVLPVGDVLQKSMFKDEQVTMAQDPLYGSCFSVSQNGFLLYDAIDEKKLLAQNNGKIAVLKSLMSAMPEEFDAQVTPLIKIMTRFVMVLPASQGMHNATSGGLLAHNLSVAIHALSMLKSASSIRRSCTMYLDMGGKKDTQATTVKKYASNVYGEHAVIGDLDSEQKLDQKVDQSLEQSIATDASKEDPMVAYQEAKAVNSSEIAQSIPCLDIASIIASKADKSLSDNSLEENADLSSYKQLDSLVKEQLTPDNEEETDELVEKVKAIQYTKLSAEDKLVQSEWMVSLSNGLFQLNDELNMLNQGRFEQKQIDYIKELMILLLCFAHDLGKLVSDLEVYSQSGVRYNPYLKTLAQFIKEQQTQKLYVRFVGQRYEMHDKCAHVGLMLLSRYCAPVIGVLSQLFSVESVFAKKDHILNRLVKMADIYASMSAQRCFVPAFVTAAALELVNKRLDLVNTTDSDLFVCGNIMLLQSQAPAISSLSLTLQQFLYGDFANNSHRSNAKLIEHILAICNIANVSCGTNADKWYCLEVGDDLVFVRGIALHLDVPRFTRDINLEELNNSDFMLQKLFSGLTQTLTFLKKHFSNDNCVEVNIEQDIAVSNQQDSSGNSEESSLATEQSLSVTCDLEVSSNSNNLQSNQKTSSLVSADNNILDTNNTYYKESDFVDVSEDNEEQSSISSQENNKLNLEQINKAVKQTKEREQTKTTKAKEAKKAKVPDSDIKQVKTTRAKEAKKVKVPDSNIEQVKTSIAKGAKKAKVPDSNIEQVKTTRAKETKKAKVPDSNIEQVKTTRAKEAKKAKISDSNIEQVKTTRAKEAKKAKVPDSDIEQVKTTRAKEAKKAKVPDSDIEQVKTIKAKVEQL